MNPTLGFRARAWLGTAVDSGRRDHLHFHLDREVMYVVHKFTKQDCENIYISWCTYGLVLITLQLKSQVNLLIFLVNIAY